MLPWPNHLIAAKLTELLKLVPGSGPESNRNTSLLAEWEGSHKDKSGALDSLTDLSDMEQLFDTLAEWNDYLENHVPYFSKPEEPEL